MRNQVEAAARAGIQARTINSANLDEWERDHRGDPSRRGRRAADQPRAAQQPRLPRRRAAPAGRHHRAAGGRRGALRLRLGSRLPARLPPAAHVPRRPARRGRRCWPPPPPPTPGSPTTWPSSSATPWCCAARSTASRCGSACSTCPRPAHRLAWLADHLDRLPGSGIVYTLTVAAAAETAEFLRSRGYAGGLLLRPGRRRRPARRRAGPARQQDQGAGGHVGAGHGLRQARPRVRRPPRRAAVADRLLPAGRPRRPGGRARRGAAAARRRGRGDLALLRLAGVPARGAGAGGAGRAVSRDRPLSTRRWSRWSTCAGPGWR